MDPVLTTYAVSTPPAWGPAAPAPGPGRGRGRAVLLALVVLVVILAAWAWYRQRHARPSCGSYSGLGASACAGLARACGQNGSCLNAVAHCMPVVDHLGAAARAGGRPAALQALATADLGACTNAIARIDPAFAAQMASNLIGPQACVPGGDAFHAARDATLNVARAARPLLPWTVEVAHALPACTAATSWARQAASQAAGLAGARWGAR